MARKKADTIPREDETIVTYIIYQAAGEPAMDGAQQGACRLCGATDLGAPFAAWVKDTFTDWDKLKAGTIICHACQFCTAEAAPGLMARVGKDKPQKMRNYSHFVLDGVWYPLSKGNKAEMRRLLFAAPPVAVIAATGQKHLLPFARAGWWTFEMATVRPFPKKLAAILAVIEPLYQAGISKTEIETGRYDSGRIMAVGASAWKIAEDQIKRWRGSIALSLALFLAQKDDNHGTSGDSGSPALATVAGDRPGVQEQIPLFDLDAV